ncbi:glycosyltransferase [Aequorivita marisscotiae]|uniref:Glycosyltransferase n=1 Tax=Aequorivita marisscotiae TaxID=3040348 RepID=A0ABY8KTH9_9FLAO|nr:glycosyltransferase [Aequorivita sp. Ant34-E75]WGF92745.1 glycosyltransferase [Aequorivita sp. Ant34-E75]
MDLQKSRIALVSPSKHSYSETFIQVQKHGLRGNVFYYYDGALPKYLENYGLLLSTSISVVNKLKQLLKLSQFSANEAAFIKSLKKNKIQVVLAQYGPTAHRILNICKFLKLPLVVHFHGYDASVKSIVEQHNYYKEVFEYASRVIAVSKLMQKKLIALGCNAQKVVLNPCAPHSDFFKVDPKFAKKQFVSVGRFTNKKAPYYIILAFKKVVKTHPDAQLIMAGNGALLNTCNNLVSFYGLENNVQFIGVIDREVFINLLEESLAFVQHSITAEDGDSEGTPVAVLEASAAGLPVISTNHAGIPDVIENGKTGLLSNEHDVKTMSENMLKLIDNLALTKQLGASGKVKVQEEFNLEKHLEVLQKTIELA